MNTFDQHFCEINRRISDLTSSALALTEKIPSDKREGNGLNRVSNEHETRSDRYSLGHSNISILEID